MLYQHLQFISITLQKLWREDLATVLQPALLLGIIQRPREVACPIIEQQLFNPFINKSDISRFKDPDASQPEIMLYVAGKAFQVGALIFSTITVLASGMAAHAGVARLMYVMGRDGVFPKSFFGYVHPKWRTPAMNIILVGAIALLAINFDLVMATALINFGALVAFTFVNLSVISQFWIREKRNKTLKDHFQYLFLPMCGALTVGALWVNLEESSMVLGLIWAAIGLIYLACVTKSFRNPVPQYEDVA